MIKKKAKKHHVKKAKRHKTQPVSKHTKKVNKHHGHSEAVIMTVLIFVVFFLLFAVMDSSVTQDNNTQNDINTTGFMIKDVIDDGKLTQQEMLKIESLSCDDIKRMLGTNKDACVYFKDSNGNIVDIFNDGSYGIGCPGLEIDGRKICVSGK